MNLVYGSLFSSYMATCVFTVMSAVNLDEPGFTDPAGSTVPPSSDSSVEHPPDSRSKCVSCPRRF